MVRVVTGHSQLLAHLNRIGVAEGDECRACEEIVKHWNIICAIGLPSLKYDRDILGLKVRTFVSDMEFLLAYCSTLWLKPRSSQQI
ncbi:hypothetical protein EVAR_73896_1 [Eumeta japonica]|uniref:Uncharacterized protein n=1 Tax=Eumeta variegata TaxID=151549 RepID=A0A4C1TCC9_EUMVA|nr:hypothetical protein EVAR_73896_1 [Eumeta japonica]